MMDGGAADAVLPPSAVAPVVPLSEAEADACFGPLKNASPLLAVSGGADSIALMGLGAGWARRNGVSVQVAVVDHGLREGSAMEADFVVAEATRLSLPCTILRWAGPKPATGLQEAARAARYTLLADHATRTGADVMVTAHTLDDQAETLLMRLAAGSGPAGMSGMQAHSRTHGMAHARPFLGTAKERLIATCRAHVWGWIEDPSNRNASFTRVRWRALLPLLAGEGLTAERLGVFARRMAENELAMQHMTGAALQRAGLERSGDGWHLDARALFSEPHALVVRALGVVLHGGAADAGVGADSHGPRLARIEACVSALQAALRGGKALTRTLRGQILTLKRDGKLAGAPEPVRRRGCVNPVHSPSLGNGLPEN